VLVTLVATGLRRAELLALDWGDLELDSEHPSLLVRRGKGGKPRRQPLPPVLARELAQRHAALSPQPNDPVFCGLAGKRLTTTILATIIRRASERAGLGTKVSAHTLRHTAATWLRQQTGDARLVAAYLGHADLSTVSRYAHVAEPELHLAVAALAASVKLEYGLSLTAARAIVPGAGRNEAGQVAKATRAGRPRRAIPRNRPGQAVHS
jgi:integrase